MTIIHNSAAPLDDARDLLARYDELSVEARLQNGQVMLAEVSARAGVAQAAALTNIATLLGVLAGVAAGGESDAGA